MPMNALQFDVSIVFLEFEVNSFTEIDVWALDGMHVFSCHLELVEVEVLWEYLHFFIYFLKINYRQIQHFYILSK